MSSLADRAKALHKEAPDLSKSSLPNLSYLLRHRELWPAGFVWNYKYGDNCAIGLNFKTWNCFPKDLARQVKTFYLQPSDSSPEHIADLIDEYVAKFPN